MGMKTSANHLKVPGALSGSPQKEYGPVPLKALSWPESDLNAVRVLLGRLG